MLSLKKWEEFLKRQISAFSSSVGVTSWWGGGTKRGRWLPSKAFQRGLSHTGGACPPPASRQERQRNVAAALTAPKLCSSERFLILSLEGLKGPHLYQGSLSVTPGLPRANSALPPPPPTALQWGGSAPEPSREVSHGAGRPSRGPADGRPLPCLEAEPAFWVWGQLIPKPLEVQRPVGKAGAVKAMALALVWRIPCLRAGDAPERPPSGLSPEPAAVLGPEAHLAGPWLSAGPAGGCEGTSWRPTCPTLFSVRTALRGAALELSCRSGRAGLLPVL